MVLLMVVTIIYMPIVLPLLLPGVSVNPWDIAKSLIVLMLIPLAIGLLIKSHSPDTAANCQPVMAKISSLAILVLLVVGLGLNISNILDLIGTGGILALLLFIVGSLLIGLLLGGRDAGIRSVMGLGTAQRNVAAALLVERAELFRDEDPAVRAGRRHSPAADPAADGKAIGRQPGRRAGGPAADHRDLMSSSFERGELCAGCRPISTRVAGGRHYRRADAVGPGRARSHGLCRRRQSAAAGGSVHAAGRPAVPLEA